MTRRSLFLLSFAPGLLSANVETVVKTENEFGKQFNEWVRLRGETPEGTYSWPALRQWTSNVEPAWKALRVSVKNE